MDRAPESPKGTGFEVLIAFLRLGCTSFGGPVAHLGYFRSELVERRRWCSEEAYAELIAVSQSLPGPGSSQVALGLGMLRAGWLGGIAAWTGFTLPSAAVMITFAFAEVALSGRYGIAFLHGLQLMAVAVIAQTVLAMRKTLAPDRPRMLIALVAACLVGFAPLSVASFLAILFGSLAGQMLRISEQSTKEQLVIFAIPWRWGATCFALSLVLLAASFVLPDSAPHPLSIAASFYRAGGLVFGGGHVVLPLLEQAVVSKGWVTERSFLSGYGAAQAMPGPLFTFAAFLGATIRSSTPRVLMGLIALVSIFLPGMLMMTGALSSWSRIRRNQTVQRTLLGVNASVVGILTASLVHPVASTACRSVADVLIAAGCLALLTMTKTRPIVVVLVAVCCSLLLTL